MEEETGKTEDPMKLTHSVSDCQVRPMCKHHQSEGHKNYKAEVILLLEVHDHEGRFFLLGSVLIIFNTRGLSNGHGALIFIKEHNFH